MPTNEELQFVYKGTPDVWLRVRQEKCGRHAEPIQAARTLVDPIKWQRKLGTTWDGVHKSTDPSRAINVARGYKN